MSSKYTESDKYQEEIRNQYQKRVTKFTANDVLKVLKILNIDDLPDPEEIAEVETGNVNATYITSKFVIKINKNHKKKTIWQIK